MIEKNFIRIWLGPNPIPEIFDKWWLDFQSIHGGSWNFITLRDDHGLTIPDSVKEIYKGVGTYAGRSDILRLLALDQLGGVYVDTDVMPLKDFTPLLNTDSPFIALRSGVSFESAIIGSPKGDCAVKDLIRNLPYWYNLHLSNSASVQTGPGFVSHYWFGRPDIVHLPRETFYPYNGFMAPKRPEKEAIFSDKTNFPPEMYAAHFSNHRWGGRPKS